MYNKAPEVNDMQEHTGKNDAVESVFPDTADMGVRFKEAILDLEKGFKPKPVCRIDFWGYESEAIRKIARELK